MLGSDIAFCVEETMHRGDSESGRWGKRYLGFLRGVDGMMDKKDKIRSGRDPQPTGMRCRHERVKDLARRAEERSHRLEKLYIGEDTGLSQQQGRGLVVRNYMSKTNMEQTLRQVIPIAAVLRFSPGYEWGSLKNGDGRRTLDVVQIDGNSSSSAKQ
ncbi:hypothetical protein MMC27_003116 [Xylographa pallens]|nr:hypothetical protein [Xylographa pallens]